MGILEMDFERILGVPFFMVVFTLSPCALLNLILSFFPSWLVWSGQKSIVWFKLQQLKELQPVQVCRKQALRAYGLNIYKYCALTAVNDTLGKEIMSNEDTLEHKIKSVDQNLDDKFELVIEEANTLRKNIAESIQANNKSLKLFENVSLKYLFLFLGFWGVLRFLIPVDFGVQELLPQKYPGIPVVYSYFTSYVNYRLPLLRYIFLARKP